MAEPDNSDGAGPPSGKRKPFGRPFQKGQSGNPGGRPRSFRSLILDRTEDGSELVELALSVARGKTTVRVGADDLKPSVKERLEAVKFLTDHAAGLPVQAVEHSGPDGGALQVIIHKEPPEGE